MLKLLKVFLDFSKNSHILIAVAQTGGGINGRSGKWARILQLMEVIIC
jgi:hypothetical protein